MQFWSSSSDDDRLVAFFSFVKYCTTVHLTRVDGVVKVCLSVKDDCGTYTVFNEQGSSTCQMITAEVTDVIQDYQIVTDK